MATATITVTFPHDIQTVWDTVTSLEHYAWRSDLGRIEIRSKTQFIEYTKEGFATTFTVTAKEPCKRWKFDIENDNIKGHWCGAFTQTDGQTTINFTEDVTAKKWFMKPLVRGYLKQQQKRYVADLQRALEL